MEAEKTLLHIEEIEEFILNGGREKVVTRLECLVQKYIFSGVRADAQDIVGEVILKIFEGKRKWNKVLFPIIERFIFLCAISELRHYVKKESRYESINGEWETIDDDDFLAFNNRFFIESDNDFLSNLEYEQKRTAILNLLDDDDAAAIVFLQLENCFRIEEIADYLGEDISFVRNAIKRLKRKTAAYLKSNIESFTN